MADIPEAIKEQLQAVGLNRQQACWEVRSGMWAVKHFACERIAAKLGIKFDPPTPLHVSADFVALSVQGHLGDLSEWSVGEASSTTSHNKYYCAMAEKRAKDRVILKLIGVHGQVYAEDEADSFTEQGQKIETLTRAGTALMAHVEFVRNNWDSVVEIKQAIADNDVMYANQLHEGFSNEEKELLLGIATTKGGIFTTAERQFFRSNESNQARKEIYNG
jgi:hypothetical protein